MKDHPVFETETEVIPHVITDTYSRDMIRERQEDSGIAAVPTLEQLREKEQSEFAS